MEFLYNGFRSNYDKVHKDFQMDERHSNTMVYNTNGYYQVDILLRSCNVVIDQSFFLDILFDQDPNIWNYLDRMSFPRYTYNLDNSL